LDSGVQVLFMAGRVWGAGTRVAYESRTLSERLLDSTVQHSLVCTFMQLSSGLLAGGKNASFEDRGRRRRRSPQIPGGRRRRRGGAEVCVVCGTCGGVADVPLPTSHLKQWALALLFSATACASWVALELLEAAQ
jgi:hypothetical protein